MRRYMLFGYVAVCLAAIVWYASSRPFHNWDMIPYAGAARALAGSEGPELHKSIYDDLRQTVSEESFAGLTVGPYRGVVYQDNEAWQQQLPFYQPRVLYVATIYLLALAGVDVFTASHLVSAVAGAAGLFLLFITFSPCIRTGLLFLVPPVAVLLGLLDMAKYSTPDGLAFLTLSVAIYFFMRHSRGLFIVLPLCVLIRTDLILFVGIVTIYFWFRRRSRVEALISLAVGVGFVVSVNAFYSYYELSIVYYNTFVRTLTHPQEFAGAYRLSHHLDALRTGLVEALSDRSFLSFAGLSVVLVVVSYRRQTLRERPRLSFLAWSSIVFLVIHFLLFPEIEARFFVAQYVLVFFVLLSILSAPGSRFRGDDAVDRG